MRVGAQRGQTQPYLPHAEGAKLCAQGEWVAVQCTVRVTPGTTNICSGAALRSASLLHALPTVVTDHWGNQPTTASTAAGFDPLSRLAARSIPCRPCRPAAHACNSLQGPAARWASDPQLLQPRKTIQGTSIWKSQEKRSTSTPAGQSEGGEAAHHPSPGQVH